MFVILYITKNKKSNNFVSKHKNKFRTKLERIFFKNFFDIFERKFIQKNMGTYFGTDGVRGEFGKNLTCELAFAIGNALTQIKTSPNVVIGHDTRISADALMLSVSAGLVQGGANVTSVGTIPTAGISFLTETENFDFGIIITASHNPPAYNGIKIFDHSGKKLADAEEDFLENFFKNQKTAQKCGVFVENLSLQKKYFNHLSDCVTTDFDGLKICLDASNGASFKIAPAIFKKLGAIVTKLACEGDGRKINTDCGCLHVENLQKKVKKSGADLGFAFDGDADRVLAVSKSGNVFDGDKLLYILAKDLKSQNKLFANSVVGTSHTNTGIMVALNRNKINLIRTDIGDKYVIDAMEKMNLRLGGEQSGHIIIRDFAHTGDGILTALKICEIVKKTNKTLEELFDANCLPQTNLNILVKDKLKIMNNEDLKNLVNRIYCESTPAGRVFVRASGTEDKVRIMVEHPSQEIAEKYANEIKDLILKI